MMTNRIAGQLGGVPYKYFGDWTDRIAKGELPFAKPERPRGVERNLVITLWAWSTPDKYLHDLISSDRRNPTVNANGKLYGSPEYSTDMMPILDPKTHTATFFKMPVRDANMPLALGPGHAASIKPAAPSPYWGDRQLWDTQRQQSQRHVRRARPVVERRNCPRPPEPGRLQSEVGSSIRQSCSRSTTRAGNCRSSIPRP